MRLGFCLSVVAVCSVIGCQQGNTAAGPGSPGRPGKPGEVDTRPGAKPPVPIQLDSAKVLALDAFNGDWKQKWAGKAVEFPVTMVDEVGWSKDGATYIADVWWGDVTPSGDTGKVTGNFLKKLSDEEWAAMDLKGKPRRGQKVVRVRAICDLDTRYLSDVCPRAAIVGVYEVVK